MATKKIHLLKPSGSRTYCRYSSRPSRRVAALLLDAFSALPSDAMCSDCAKHAKHLSSGAGAVVHHIEPGEVVVCETCRSNNDDCEHGYGQAFLAGPDHPPFDGNCHHFCRAHLAPDAILPSST